MPDAWWGERWCLLMDRTGITDMVEGLVGAVGGGCARCAAKSARTLPLCDVSRPSVTCPFRMVLGAVVAVAQQVCHDRRGYLGDEVPQRGVACSEHADAQSARHGLRV